jgi:hypothetical protein
MVKNTFSSNSEYFYRNKNLGRVFGLSGCFILSSAFMYCIPHFASPYITEVQSQNKSLICASDSFSTMKEISSESQSGWFPMFIAAGITMGIGKVLNFIFCGKFKTKSFRVNRTHTSNCNVSYYCVVFLSGGSTRAATGVARITLQISKSRFKYFFSESSSYYYKLVKSNKWQKHNIKCTFESLVKSQNF